MHRILELTSSPRCDDSNQVQVGKRAKRRKDYKIDNPLLDKLLVFIVQRKPWPNINTTHMAEEPYHTKN
jgi:hypothetical protein